MTVELKIVWHTFFCDVCGKAFYQEAGQDKGHFFKYADIKRAYANHKHGKELDNWRYYDDLNEGKSSITVKEKCKDCNKDLKGVRDRMTITNHDTHEIKGYQCMDCFFEDEEGWER